MFGAHLSIAGGLHNALIEADRLRMDCVQIFTKNQRRWAAKPISDGQIDLWDRCRREINLDAVVSHDSYLINLASPDRSTREKSIALLCDEIERCEALAIPCLVAHPGAHLGLGQAAGLKRIVGALGRVHRSTRGCKTLICLENTAGQGTNLGHDLRHLRRIIDDAAEPHRLAVCIDTAHALAAGYDLTSAAGARRFLEELDEVIGLGRVRALHLNDSKTPRGSRADRHQHIGRGHVALDAFRVIVNHPAFQRIPRILETPKGQAPDGRPWDAVNLEKLRSLVKRRPRGGTRR